MSSAAPLFVDVSVEPHDALPDGLMLRFKAAPDARPESVTRLRYVPEETEDDGEARWYRVEGRDAADRPLAATAVLVEDSAAGVSMLVYGGEHGLRLFAEGASGGEAPLAETHLLLPPGDRS